MNQVLEREILSPTDSRKLVHYTQCHDLDTAMCGMDVTDEEFKTVGVDCVVCADLAVAEMERDYCGCQCCE